ncbi:MAG: lytic transglycosylase domain-containing protein [Magnetovibrionaceae bacterium]
MSGPFTTRRRVFLGLAGFLAVSTVGPALGHHTGNGRVKLKAVSARQRRRIQRMVVREALDLGVQPWLGLAVAHVESDFNPRALSPAGARGVMQIMPATALGEYGIEADALWHPRLNIRMGLHFLKRLIHRYQGRTDLALSYYNGGSRVGRPGKARVLPYTQAYVDKVHRLARRYARDIALGRV